MIPMTDQSTILDQQCFIFQVFHGQPYLVTSHGVLACWKYLLKGGGESCWKMNAYRQGPATSCLSPPNFAIMTPVGLPTETLWCWQGWPSAWDAQCLGVNYGVLRLTRTSVIILWSHSKHITKWAPGHGVSPMCVCEDHFWQTACVMCRTVPGLLKQYFSWVRSKG